TTCTTPSTRPSIVRNGEGWIIGRPQAKKGGRRACSQRLPEGQREQVVPESLHDWRNARLRRKPSQTAAERASGVGYASTMQTNAGQLASQRPKTLPKSGPDELRRPLRRQGEDDPMAQDPIDITRTGI